MPPSAPARAGPRGERLLVVGHLNVDHLLEVPRLPRADRTVPVTRHRIELGGTAANLALAARAEGLDVGLVGRIGEDYPPAFRARLRRAGIDLRGVETVPGVPTPACFIAFDPSGKQATWIDQGPMAEGGRFDPARLRGVAWVHLSTGAPDYLAAIAQAAHAAGVPVSVDPAQEIHYRWSSVEFVRALSGAEILFGNEAEIAAARRLTHVAATRDLLATVPLVIETRGRRGARAFARTGALDVPAERGIRVRDPTGAGDAFRAGFYAGWLRGNDLAGTLKSAHRVAGRWIRRRAAT